MKFRLNIICIFFLASSCYAQSRTGNRDYDSLKSLLIKLKLLSLDFKNLYPIINEAQTNGVSVNRGHDKWLFGLHNKDSLQFDRADELRPICKLFENKNVLSIVFLDTYDYKQALHIFNFHKPELKPASSFIFYSIGGDAEAFWNIECKQLDVREYEITESWGHHSDIQKRDTTYFDFRQKRKITIDKATGQRMKEILKTERNLVEIK